MRQLKILFASFTAMIFLVSLAQQDELLETLKKKLYEYTQEHPSTLLYVHTDKTIYNPGENVWFKAYVLSGNVIDNKVLNIRLIDKNKKLIIREQFPMYDFRAHGELVLPDSLREGDYTLYAYSDRMINFSEGDIFKQIIKVRTGTGRGLQATASVIDTIKLKRGEEVGIEVLVRDGDNLVKNAKGEYRLFVGERFVSGEKIRINSDGEAHFSFIYPQISDKETLKLSIKINRDKDFADLNLNLRHEGIPILFSAYPEGGHLIEGLDNKLAIYAKDVNNIPVRTIVVLKSGEQEITRVQTNLQGIGIITLNPLAGAKYSLELLSKGESRTEHFPVTEIKGYGLKLSNRNTIPGALILNKGEAGRTLVVLRSYEEILWSKTIEIASGDSAIISIPPELPKEVLAITIFDEKGNLKAERLMLNRATGQEDYNVNIQTDQQQYGAWKKITVNITTTDDKGVPVSANISVAAVERGRTDISNYRTILHSYRNRFLKGDQTMITSEQEKEINDLLLTQKWRSADWIEALSYTAKGTLRLIKNTDGLTGTVIPNKKKR